MKIFFLLLSISITSHAALIDVWTNDIYLGKEYYNNKPTGNTCVVQINEVSDLSSKGQHCNKLIIDFKFTTKPEQIEIKEDGVSLYSRITNYHHARYKTDPNCAEPIADFNSKGEQVDIYSEDDEYLYNQLFSNEIKIKGASLHTFLTFDKSKRPTMLKVHRLSWFSEKDWDCKNLMNANPL